MTFSTVFEIPASAEGMPMWPILLVALASVAAVLFAYYLRKQFPRDTAVKSLRFIVSGVGIGGLAIACLMYAMKARDGSMIESVRNGGVKVVDGIVENFHAMPKDGHDTERFTVRGVPFAYSDFDLTGGFNNTASHGGPIASGIGVRITYVQTDRGNLIVKLELSQPRSQTTSLSETLARMRHE